MRASLIPGLLEIVHRTMAKQIGSMQLFEAGKVFVDQAEDALPKETEMLAALWTGNRSGTSWHGAPEVCDFYDIKGALEAMFAGLHLPKAVFTATEADKCDVTQPGQSATVIINGNAVGMVGKLHPQVQRQFNLKQPAFVFEMDMEQIYAMMADTVQAVSVPKYPSTDRDATIIIDSGLEANDILRSVEALEEPLVENVFLFDVFEGSPIEDGKKSVSFRITYRSAEATLEDDAVNGLHKGIVDRIVGDFGAMLPA
jgi:phenylalanyl-tRNA synthetase beta chain